MENSQKIHFGDDATQWFVAVGERWMGPLSAGEIHRAIQDHKMTPAHYAWKKGQSEWKRICDIKIFQSIVPQTPSKEVREKVKEAAKPAVRHAPPKKGGKLPPPGPSQEDMEEDPCWYLHFDESQYGPFTLLEVRRLLQIGKVKPRAHAWRDGMEDWERLESLDAFRSVGSAKPATWVDESDSDSSDLGDKRGAPRRPLVAKIMISNEQSVIVGVCRDISVGGLQVLTERIPGKIGARLKMNISPSGTRPGVTIQPFVAEGVIVRVLEDGRGFSFRFEKLSEKAKQAIEAYIDSL